MRLAILLLSSLPLLAQDSLFDFQSDFHVNLHHFLYEQAREKEPVPGGGAAWKEALEFYRKNVVTTDLLDDHMAEINNWLPRTAEPGFTAPPVDAPLHAVLLKAAPIYRATWWTDHDRANHLWISKVTPIVQKYGPGMARELTKLYGVAWPASPIRTDIAEYGSWAGAYTNDGPPHITMSSTNETYRDSSALEMLFHEASHVLDQKLRDALTSEAAKQNRLFKRRGFSHAVIFYTAGELTRRRIDGYLPYAIKHNLWDRGWPGALPVLEQHWKPYIDGKIDFAEAVKRLVEAYTVARPAQKP